MTTTPGSWRPGADLATLRLRARCLALARQFFAARDVLEVETPQLVSAPVSDQHIRNIRCELSGALRGPAWLHTSAEYHMKRLLAAGSPDIYQLCKVFRDGEAGGQHLPEFTMIEWYRRGMELAALAEETCALVREIGGEAGRAIGAAITCSYQQLFVEIAGIDPLAAGVADIARRSRELLPDHGIGDLAPGLGDDRDAWLDLLVVEVIQPALRDRGLVVVDRFPASQAALARLDAGDPRVAERFEVYLDGVELANGYRELTDPAEQRRRTAAGEPALPVDEEFIAALEAGLPECSGVAVGFDRVLMACLGRRSIVTTVSFASPG